MGGVVAYRSLPEIATQARPYPADVLEGCETGLVLFAAAFLGHNDAIHFALEGIDATCVDADGERLEEMRALYPETWEFVEADVWAYAEAAEREGIAFDVVSLDPFTNDMDRVWAEPELWFAIASRAVVIGLLAGTHVGRIPAGWTALPYVERTADVFWVPFVRGS